MSQQPPTSYNVGYSPSYQTAGRKRSHAEHHMQPELPSLEQHLNPYVQATGSVSLAHTPQQGYSLHQYHPSQAPQQQHTLPPTHHHHLPNTHRSKRHQMDPQGSPSSPISHHGPPSVVGAQGMPPPAPRPRGPKLKFTPEDDQLLVDLKEKKNLTWKQIADFFPGRSSGTLQVRYCTKLKAKTTVWTDEMVAKLRTSMQEYENDKWRIISSKVGAGFSPVACKDKAEELKAIEMEQEEDNEHQDQSVYVQSEMPGGHGDPSATSYQ
ncbi:myb dna-binding domain-containing protein [Stagonosporopsis vannaccii]|nr:myb dna-binding domain-containing protein [Stagonosporopsis vannaccii]